MACWWCCMVGWGTTPCPVPPCCWIPCMFCGIPCILVKFSVVSMDKERERERERERDDLVRSLVAAAGCGQASSVFGGKTVWRPFGSRTSDKTSVFVVYSRERWRSRCVQRCWAACHRLQRKESTERAEQRVVLIVWKRSVDAMNRDH